MIPYVPINENRREELQIDLSNCNKTLKKYYKQVAHRKGSRGFVTSNNESINRPKYYKQILGAYRSCPTADINLHGVLIPNCDVRAIVFLEDIRWEILTSISGMLTGLANKKNKSKSLCDSALSFEDLESEAFKSALSSIHSYAKEKICFSTYFYVCANRHISSLCSRSNSMSKLSKKSIKLKRRYIEVQKSLGRNSNFEEVVELMNLKENEIELLRSTLNCFVSHHDEKTTMSKHYAGVDGAKHYSSSGKRGGDLILSSNNTFVESLDDKEIGGMNLTDLEKAVLEGFMQSSSKLGINSVAKNVVNPKTGKPFSRMAVTYAWRRVKEKINNFRKVA